MGAGLGVSGANGLSAFGGLGVGQTGAMAPQQTLQQQARPQQPPPTNAATGQAQGKDPFADLVGLF